jgi:CHAT domain/WD domain, G-beta repeat
LWRAMRQPRRGRGSMTEHDFRVEIGMRGPDGYGVILRAPDGGEETVSMQLPVSDSELDALAARVPGTVITSSIMTRDAIFTAEQPVRQLGTLLFEALLGEGGRALLTASRNQAARQGKQLRVVLQVRPPELARLPWEFMFDSRAEEYICLASPLIRYPLVLKPVLPMRVTPPLRILGMVARPTDRGQLATADEVGRLDGALSDLVRAGLIELGWVDGQTWRDLRDAMWHGPWHIFHFIGHGAADPASREGALALASHDSTSYNLGADELAMLLGDHFPLRLVVLNACDTDHGTTLSPFSSVARTLIRRGSPAVLAMQNEISNQAAVEFSRTFYAALAGLQSVDLAVMHARRAIRLALPGSLEWGTPVLYMHSADGALFGPADSMTSLATGATDPASQGSVPAEHKSADDRKPGRTRKPVGDRKPTATRKRAATRSASASQLRAEPLEVAGIRTHDQVNAVTFNADGTLLGFACDGRLALLIDQIGRECLRLRHGIGVLAVRDIQIDPAGGTRIATAADKAALIWDMATGDLLREVTHADTVRRVAFSPDGRYLATASVDMTARIWDTATGRQLLEIPHVGSVLDVRFSPDGRTIATAGSAGTARLCVAATGDEVRVFEHDGTVRAVAFSPDGQFLATVSTDSTARIWDIGAGGQLVTVQHEGPVRAVAFSPDGHFLATGSQDRIIQLWQIAKDGGQR